MSEQLERGKTVIATRKVLNNDNEPIEIEIIYDGEEGTGYWRDKRTGTLKVMPANQYKEVLAEYHRQQEKKGAIDGIIDENGSFGRQEQQPEQEKEPEQEEEEDTSLSAQDKKEIIKTEEEGKKIDRKKILIPVIVLAAMLFILLVVLAISMFTKKKTASTPVQTQTAAAESQTKSDTVAVAVLANDIALGQQTIESDFEQTYVSKDTFDMLSRTMYIGSDGSTHEGTVILWQDVDLYVGCIALRDLESGSVAMADDFSLSRSGITGQTTIRLVAVISSGESEDIVCELGRYVVEAGSLIDILNSQDQSVLNNIFANRETETQAQEETTEAATAEAAQEETGSETGETAAEGETGTAGEEAGTAADAAAGTEGE